MTLVMSEKHVRPQVRVKSTEKIPFPNEYIKSLQGEFSDYAFDEVKTPHFQGKWRKDIFQVSDSHPVDLEIGTGNGFHFGHYVEKHPERCLVGFELKYKPLIQTIRRAVRNGCENARICRYDAHLICDVFEKGELDNVIIHFPDPYLKKKFRKKRLLNPNFLVGLFELQKPGSRIDFKTDSEDYFDFAMENFHKSSYEVVFETRDLHRSERAESNFITAFERIFMNQGLPIYSAEMVRV